MTLSNRIELARALFGTDSAPASSVVRITGVADTDSDNGTVTVTLDGGDPIEVGCIGSVSEGDTVTVHVQGTSAQVIGAEGWGDEINALAAQARSDAATAADAAALASSSASDALFQLSTVESVVGALQWVTDHATYIATTDTGIISGKWYFTRSGSGTTEDPYSYSYDPSPPEDPSAAGYYEIESIDEAVSNYVSSHLALTSQGLWLINDENSYKMLAASDSISIYDANGSKVASYGQMVQLGASSGMHLVLGPDSMAFEDASGVSVAYIEVDSQNNSLFHVTNAVIVKDLRFGGGDWIWEARPGNRNLSLKWIGGSI